jgi:pyridoxamine 5'-phosphate oxidase family protein
MSVFTEAEVAYMQHQRLGRLATVGSDGMPHVVPIGFYFDLESDTIQIGGLEDTSMTKKWSDLTVNPQAALVVDDIISFDPAMPRGIEIRGRAQLLTEGGENLGEKVWGFRFASPWIRLAPERLVSWGIDTTGFKRRSRSVT